MSTQHTPGPWRVGDAGATVFGPPNGNTYDFYWPPHKIGPRIGACRRLMRDCLRRDGK